MANVERCYWCKKFMDGADNPDGRCKPHCKDTLHPSGEVYLLADDLAAWYESPRDRGQLWRILTDPLYEYLRDFRDLGRLVEDCIWYYNRAFCVKLSPSAVSDAVYDALGAEKGVRYDLEAILLGFEHKIQICL
jgi:hypothetical protein